MAGPPTSTTEDIRKMGHLIKIKTNKRKYFVLRDESKASSARLEYYDNEKKYRNGHAPKRSITLKNCFNINSKPDAKHKYAIALYTQDDCFAIACVSEEEQQDWLLTMIELRSRNIDENSEARPLFEHMWPVTVKSRGLGGSERKVIPGQYRLCLTNKDLSLIRTMKNDQSDIVLPLDCIRRCGHTHQFFFLELGRSAKTGSGNLWLQVEDNVIAQNIHEALLSSMKNNEVPAPGIFRIRSGSSAMEKGRKRTSIGSTGVSSSLQPKRSHSIYTSNPSPKSSHDTKTPADGRLAPVAGNVLPIEGATSGAVCPKSSLSDGTIEEETARPDQPDDYMTITPVTPSAVGTKLPTKFPSSSKLSERAESAQFGKSPGHGMETIPGYASSKTLVVPTLSSGPDSASGSTDDYVPMETPTNERYMEMRRKQDDTTHCTLTEEHGSNSSVSSVISSVGSMSVTESSERSFHSLSQLQEIPMADAGYIEMASPQNSVEQPGLCVIRPDVVPCYVRDESAEDFPKRAYSVGSKPVPVPNKPLNNSYIDMSGRSKAKDPEKSSSAPHLNDDDEKKKELSDLFMELDFNRGKRDVGHKDQMSRGKEFRERASSGGSRELRMKAMSFSTKEAIQRLSLFGRNKTTTVGGQHADGRRARTSTICQESLRPRTSSFGPSDLRPRSSSGGNACFHDVVSKQMQIASSLSSQDSLRRHGSKRSSQESVDSAKGDAYMDMNMSKRSSDRLSKMSESDAGYIDMRPGDDASANYMQMTAGASSSSGTALGTSGSSSSSSEMTVPARTIGGIMMRQKLETVKAGSGDDYLEMVAEGSGGSSSSQSKPRSSAASVQPRPRATKSLVETGSNYLEMAPMSLSSEGTVSGKKETPAPTKYTDYMEMSASSAPTGSSTIGSSLQSQIRLASSNPSSQVVQANHVRHSDKHETSVTSKVTSPKKDGLKNCTTQQQQQQQPHPGSTARDAPSSTDLDVPPPPFDLSIPLHSFLHYSDHTGENTPTIPSHSATSRTPHLTSGTTVDSLEAPVLAQISYATLDLGTSVNDSSGGPVSDGKTSGMLGRTRGFMPGSSQHVYAQIDFGKSDDHGK